MTRIVLPHLSERPDGISRVVEQVERRLARAPTGIAQDLALGLDLAASRLVALAITRRMTPITALPPPEGAEAFAAWGRSGIPAARTVYEALRRLVLSTYYDSPEARSDIGMRAPLHTRTPELPWEGPLPGVAAPDSEPVARWTTPGVEVPGSRPSQRVIPAAVTVGSTLRGDTRLTADVVIVGSGAGGGVAAAILAESGRDVVILEEGEYLHAPDFDENEGELVPRLYADNGLRATTDGSVLLFQGANVGGGTTVNWMLMFRTPDHVLEEWQHEHGITGFSPAEMAPVFDRIEREVHARRVPDDAHTPANRLLLDGARALGWRASNTTINATDCVRAGTCSLGCRFDAKQGGLLTYLPRAFAAGARLFTSARVDRVELFGAPLAGGVQTMRRKRVHAVVRDPRTGTMGARVTVEAPIVILAAGAVGTPAIIERSGLGGGGVGRFLRLHPTTAVMGRYDREIYQSAGIPQSVVCDEFNRRDANGYGFWIECPALQPGQASAALSGFGAAHLDAMRGLANTAPFIVLARDGSGQSTSHGCVWVDRRGRTRIRYVPTPADRANIAAGVEAAARIHLAAGAREALSLHTTPVRATGPQDLSALAEADYGPNRVGIFSAHVNGTCRMGLSPDTSGVNPDGERHGVPGLYVCDGSLLPTSLGVNPQETIMALSSMIASRIVASR